MNLEVHKKYITNHPKIRYVVLQAKLEMSGTYAQYYYVGWPILKKTDEGTVEPIYYYKSGRTPNSWLLNGILDLTGEYNE